MNKKEECHTCGEPIKGKWDSQVELGLETGELDRDSYHQQIIHRVLPSSRILHFIYDKHIKCSPSRAQRIVHSKYPTVIDERPQFDWRPEADNAWTDEMRTKWKKVYIEAWIRLQEKHNPDWKDDKNV